MTDKNATLLGYALKNDSSDKFHKLNNQSYKAMLNSECPANTFLIYVM